MKPYRQIKSLFLALSAIATTITVAPQARAVSFAEQQIGQERLAVVAVPFGYQEYRLEIIEQISDKQPCWQEAGTAPVQVDLLLTNFDYTHSCRRAVDTNGYTLRLNGQDDRVAHIIKIVQDKGELKLVAFHKNPARPSVEIGSTNGLSDRPMKIVLNPGWQITKRVHQGKIIDHFYLSGNPNSANRTYSTSTSSTTVNGTNSTTTTTNSTSVNSGTHNSNVPPVSSVDPQAVADSVEQIYQNIVTPLLRDLSQQQSPAPQSHQNGN